MQSAAVLVEDGTHHECNLGQLRDLGLDDRPTFVTDESSCASRGKEAVSACSLSEDHSSSFG